MCVCVCGGGGVLTPLRSMIQDFFFLFILLWFSLTKKVLKTTQFVAYISKYYTINCVSANPCNAYMISQNSFCCCCFMFKVKTNNTISKKRTISDKPCCC